MCTCTRDGRGFHCLVPHLYEKLPVSALSLIAPVSPWKLYSHVCCCTFFGRLARSWLAPCLPSRATLLFSLWNSVLYHFMFFSEENRLYQRENILWKLVSSEMCGVYLTAVSLCRLYCQRVGWLMAWIGFGRKWLWHLDTDPVFCL